MPAHGSNSYPGEQDCKSCASRGDRVGDQPQLNVRQRLALLRFAELAIPVERLVSMVHFVPFLVQHDEPVALHAFDDGVSVAVFNG